MGYEVLLKVFDRAVRAISRLELAAASIKGGSDLG